MGAFSYISTATEKEIVERYRILSRLGSGLKEMVLPHMPGYIYGTIGDMGIPGEHITGYWMQLPPSAKGMMKNRILKTINRCRQFGADIVVVDRSLNLNLGDCKDMMVSNGMFYTPFAFIDALKKLAALMGFDFKLSNICIVNAATEAGLMMTELLLGEAMHITLCTEDRDSLNGKIYRSLLNYGVSPVIMSNYRKAIVNSDLIIYTGGADMTELSSYVEKKVLIANISGEKLSLGKDLLSFDDVILQSREDPKISGDGINTDKFMTSRIWEGALLCISGFEPGEYSVKQAKKIYRIAKEYDIAVKAVVGDGKLIDRYNIYKYR